MRFMGWTQMEAAPAGPLGLDLQRIPDVQHLKTAYPNSSVAYNETEVSDTTNDASLHKTSLLTFISHQLVTSNFSILMLHFHFKLCL